MTLTTLRPMLEVNDMAATIGYWTEVLGFTVTSEMSAGNDQPPGWCNLSRDGVSIMFTWEAEHSHDDGLTHRSEAALAGSLYFNTDDVDGLYEELRQNPALGQIERPADRPHGMRDMFVEDPNGFRVFFGRPL